MIIEVGEICGTTNEVIKEEKLGFKSAVPKGDKVKNFETVGV